MGSFSRVGSYLGFRHEDAASSFSTQPAGHLPIFHFLRGLLKVYRFHHDRQFSRSQFQGKQCFTKTRNGIKSSSLRARSSVGRALEWHSRGRRFDPDRVHLKFDGKTYVFSLIPSGVVDSPEPIEFVRFRRVGTNFLMPRHPLSKKIKLAPTLLSIFAPFERVELS